MGKSEATGERLEEAKHINRSLSALGDVMSALANKDARHVPFRNSKLTQLLQDSLCGQAKAMMFIHVAPEVRVLLLSIAWMQHLLIAYLRSYSEQLNYAQVLSSPYPICLGSHRYVLRLAAYEGTDDIGKIGRALLYTAGSFFYRSKHCLSRHCRHDEDCRLAGVILWGEREHIGVWFPCE